MQQLVSGLPTACLIHTATGQLVASSDAFVELTGYEDLSSLEDWLRRGCGMTPEQAAESSARLCRDGPSAPADCQELEIRTKQGRGLYCRVHLGEIFSGDAARRWFTYSLVDVTEFREAQRKVVDREAFVERIFQTHPDILYVYDIQRGAPVFQNRLMGSDVGYSLEEIEEMGDQIVAKLLHPDDMPRFAEHVQRLAKALDGEILTLEHRMRHRDGSWRWHVSSDTVFRRDEHGVPVEILGTARDVTESKRIQQEKLAMSAQVQELQKMESLAMLAGGVAHDFNNLLVGVMGSADLAMGALPSSSPAMANLKRIQSTAAECAELCKQLLAYAGKGKFVVEPFHLPAMVEQIGQLLQIGISSAIALRYDFAEGVPPVEGDTRQVRQVIMNLIKNASDAIGDEGGTIRVSVGQIFASRGCLESVLMGDELDEGPYVTLEVSDTGCGIPEDSLDQIFDPFFSSKRVGRGLGLAAVRGIIASHGGAIRVDSELGRGTSFKILLPASQSAVRPADSRAAPSKGSLGGGVALVVDDEETVRQVAAQALERMGFTVITAADGAEAIGVYRTRGSTIRAVLLDVMMPRMGGVETFRQLRDLDPGVRVVFMSGYDEQEAIGSLAGKRLAGFVQKPFRQSDLLAALEAALQTPGSR